LLQLKKSVVLASLKLPFREALGVAARMGAEGVEINARTELRPAELSQTGIRQIRKWLGDFNLSVSCVQFPTNQGYESLERIDERIEGTKAAMRLANDLGCRIVSNRIGPIPSDQADSRWGTLTTALHDLAAYSLKSGAWLAIRTGTNSGPELADLLTRFPQGALAIDFDPAELMIFRHSPEEAIKALGQAVAHFRARDAVRDMSSGSTMEVQLGRGTIDFSNLLGMLEEHQYRGFISVERNQETGSAFECSQALEYLEQLFS
jgi:sugar phosphate isomerase/epimerase